MGRPLAGSGVGRTISFVGRGGGGGKETGGKGGGGGIVVDAKTQSAVNSVQSARIGANILSTSYKESVAPICTIRHVAMIPCLLRW